MDNKKAQGISINFIVIAAIAALVLVIIIAFTTGSFGNLFSQITTSSGTELDTTKTNCQSLCNTAEATISDEAGWLASSYCTKEYNIDVDGDGSITNAEVLNCFDTPIDIFCSFAVGDYNAASDATGCTFAAIV